MTTVRILGQSRRSPTPRRRACVLILLSAALVACSSSKPVTSGDGSIDKPPAADEGGTSSQDASDDRDCMQTSNPGICSPIVHCAPCDGGGLCGAVSNLDGCDQEGATCTSQGDRQQVCTGATCTCSNGFWQCAPLGHTCPRIGDSCGYLVNFGGGGVSIFYCRSCQGDGGGPTWSAGCAATCGEVGSPCCAGDDCGVGNLTCIHDSASLPAGTCVDACGDEGRPCCADGGCPGAAPNVVCAHDAPASTTGTCRACGVLGGPCCPGTIPSRACGIGGLVCDTSASPEGRCSVAGSGSTDAATGDARDAGDAAGS
jgi:hypothetical protein